MAAERDKLLDWKTSSSDSDRALDAWRLLPVVSVGNDRKLLELRERVIQLTGLRVQSLTPEEAGELAHSRESYIWVFCNTVELDPLTYLASTVRRYSPESRLVLIEGPRHVGSEAALFHRIIEPGRGVDLLLATLRVLAIEGVEKERWAG